MAGNGSVWNVGKARGLKQTFTNMLNLFTPTLLATSVPSAIEPVKLGTRLELTSFASIVVVNHHINS
jgi:hypothetical protein